MQPIITFENHRSFAYSNGHLIRGRVQGVVLSFFGLGGTAVYDTDPGDALDYAEQGILYVVPYFNPWCWMNRQAVAFVDEILEVLIRGYGLDPQTVKTVSTGGSMGGLCAIVYSAYAKITPCACVVNCPVCDLPYHYTERPDLPRTLYSAFGGYEGTMQEALESCSPLHLVPRLPKIPYTVFHCEEDKAVNLERHSRLFVDKMKDSHSVTLITVPRRGHCDLSPEMRVAYVQSIRSAITHG